MVPKNTHIITQVDKTYLLSLYLIIFYFLLIDRILLDI